MNINLTDMIIDAYKVGMMDGRKSSQDALTEKNETIQTLKINIEGLKIERDAMVRRINELTSEQWDVLKNIIDKIYPGNALTAEDIRDRAGEL